MTEDADRMYVVVRNDEDQYSVWWADRPVPAGWHAVTEADSRDACLARVEELWTDMRPRSLRDSMAARDGR